MTNSHEPPAAHALDELTHEPPLRERARDRLEQLIVSGVYKPGEHLVETDLAKRLGVSRGPVREALYMLELQGWVDLRPRQGAFVHAPTLEEIDHFFHVRILLETEIATLVAQSFQPTDFEHLSNAINEARKALARGDEAQVIAANARFHGYVHRLSGNPVLVELMGSLDKRLRWYYSPVAMERAAEAWDEHEALIAALAKGDADRAVEISRSHSEHTRTAYIRFREAEEQAGAGVPVGGPSTVDNLDRRSLA